MKTYYAGDETERGMSKINSNRNLEKVRELHETAIEQAKAPREVYRVAIEQYESAQKSYRFLAGVCMIMCGLDVALIGCFVYYFVTLF